MISNNWGKVVFLEVHPACTSSVMEMIKKLEWLKNMLKNDALELNKMKANNPYHWVASGKVAILTTSKEYRQCVAHGIKPKSLFSL